MMADHGGYMQTEDVRVRPDVFTASAWFFIAAALRLILSRGARWLVFIFAGLDTDIRVTAQRGYEIVFLLCALALPALLYAGKGPGQARGIRLKGAKESLCLMGALLGILGVPTAQLITGWWCCLLRAAGARVDVNMAFPASVPALIVSVLLSGLLAGVCEEVFFRGGFMGGMERRGVKKGFVLTLFAFILMHASFTGVWAQAYMGVVLGLMVLYGDSVWPCVCAHVSYNITTLLLGYFMDFNLSRAVVSLVGYGEALPVLLADTAGCLLVSFAGVAVFRRMCKNAGVVPPVPTVDAETGDARETLLLVAGFFTSCAALAMDALSLFTAG